MSAQEQIRSLALRMARQGLSAPDYAEFHRLCDEAGSSADLALWDAMDLIEAQEDQR